MPYLCIGIAGLPRAGKNTAARILETLFQNEIAIVETGAILEEILRGIFEGTELKVDTSRRDLKQNTYSSFKKYASEGGGWLSQAVRRQWEMSGKRIYAFNGLLLPSDLELVQSYPQHLILYLCASFKTRLRRAQQSSEKGDERGISEEEFQKKHQHETALFVESISGLAQNPNQKIVIVENETDNPRRLGEQIITALLNTYLFAPYEFDSRCSELEMLYQKLTHPR